MALAFNFVRFGLSSSITLLTWNDLISLIWVPTFGGVSNQILGVFTYLSSNLFGIIGYDVVLELLTYWTITSVIYLIFDVLMYVPLLAHRWIDKARIE